MQGMTFYDTDEGHSTNENGRAHEVAARVLFNAYVALILTFRQTAE